jgi:hypothetical protein
MAMTSTVLGLGERSDVMLGASRAALDDAQALVTTALRVTKRGAMALSRALGDASSIA